MKRAAFTYLLAGAAAVPRIACAQSAPTVIRLGTAPVESYALAFYGVDRGFFKAVNLDVQIQPFSGGGGVMTAAAGGALDIGCANVGAQANAHVHWHVAPLPPGVPYDRQEFGALRKDNGILDLPEADQAELARTIRSYL